MPDEASGKHAQCRGIVHDAVGNGSLPVATSNVGGMHPDPRSADDTAPWVTSIVSSGVRHAFSVASNSGPCSTAGRR